MEKPVSAEQIEVLEVSISSERFLEGKKLFLSGNENEASVGVELQIYENIFMPYLTGYLLVQDDNDLYRVAEIKGTERVNVRFRSPGSDVEIKKVFIITNIQKSIKVNDQMSQLLFEIIEDHGYFNDLQLVNRSYNGTGIEMIEKILLDNTNKKIRPNYFKDPVQKSFRYIVPWQTAYEAINTILNFITTDNSFPYFLYSSLNSEDLILTDLESILDREPFNQNIQPFLYSQGKIAYKNTIEDQAFNISNLETNNQNDTLALAKMGAVGTSFENIDTLSSNNVDLRIDMEQEYEKLSDAAIINLSNNRIPIDNKFRVDGKEDLSITDLNSRRLTLLSHTPYKDTGGLVSEPINAKEIVIKNNYLKYLHDGSFDITVPGLAMGVKNIDRAVGHTVNVNILKEGDTGKQSMLEDERRSGTFVMLAKNHVFNLTQETHNVVVKLGRITEPRRIDD
mgnify:CR=1 FL=1